MGYSSPGENATLEVDDASGSTKVVFLIIIMLTSFVGSLLVIVVIAHNLKLRTAQNVFIANVCALCVADCTLNMAIVLGALMMKEWIYGDFMCKVNIFFLNAVSVATALMLTALCVDRYLSLRFTHKYETWLSSHRLYVVIACVWVHAITFSLPFLTDAVQSVYRPKLYVCTVTSETSIAFLYATLILCFLVPFITIVVFHVLAFRLSCELSYTQCEGDAQRQTYAHITKSQSLNSEESRRTAFTMCLTAAWLVSEVPYITITYIKHAENDKQPANVSDLGYPWELGVAFIWMRFGFSAVFPLVTLILKKEIWRGAKETLTCRRNNAIVDVNVKGQSSAVSLQKETSENETTPRKHKSKDKEGTLAPSKPTFKVPVLFATSTGICIEDPGRDCSFDTFKLNPDLDTFEMKGKALDIAYSDYEYGCELFGDTSDYDSSCEIDPYSSSQPVSSRHIHGTFHRTRSMSDPEVNFRSSHDKSTTASREKKKDLSETFGADSGLDLSATAGSSLGSANSRTSGDSRKSFINRKHGANKTDRAATLDNITCERETRKIRGVTNNAIQKENSDNTSASRTNRGINMASVGSVMTHGDPGQGPRQHNGLVSPHDGLVPPHDVLVPPHDGRVAPKDGRISPRDGQDEKHDGEFGPATVVRVRSSSREMNNSEDILSSTKW